MGWTSKQVIIAIILVATGSINTISTKWANLMKSVGSDNGEPREFNHPFFQACCMFFGEFLCLLCFKAIYYWLKRKQDGSEDVHDLVKGNRNFNPFIFLPPAMCDMIGTSLMYVGLNFTFASSFQMLRGAVIVFVALLSVIFLGRKVTLKMWIGIVLTLSGLVVVGLCDVMYTSDDTPGGSNVIIGDLIIFGAQVVVAIQMVVEEKFVNGKDIPPLQAVGWEGIFGFVTLCILLIPFYFIHVPQATNPHGALEDLPDALYQIYNNFWIAIALTGTIISIAFFNFAGISVTKEMSATTRMVLDSVRILFIYLFSLCVKWQEFHELQILGFVLLIIGMAIYNDLLPSFATIRALFRRDRDDALVPNESI
ncbi:solute carrier family 35 member F6 [Halyomorpha halys]|uniref:solute carrier family 35 member F6 n=1 Tax=Halyomorpha halys TaxID=286706 RepID=UPI0006D4EA99|nr:solute carrier family 35 member F6 [Halyomorpha halys]